MKMTYKRCYTMLNVILPDALLQTLVGKRNTKNAKIPPQPFYSSFSGTIRVSWYQKRTSGLFGARED